MNIWKGLFWWWMGLIAGLGVAGERGPYVRVLGTAQDGGLPQIGCMHENCRRARDQAQRRRWVASLLVVERSGGKRWLLDATPDIREQLARFGEPASEPAPKGRRPKLVDGIFLTHAHMGHYTGLIHLGREAYHHPEIPLYGSERMCAFLKDNGPWNLLVRQGNIVLHPLQPDRPVTPGGTGSGQVTVTPFSVPHRDEYTDTFGYLVRGPRRSLAYIPDIDKWERWERDIEALIARVDIALLDGTFFAEGEIPGRAMSEIPHPFIAESLARFSRLPEKERRKIVFIHLNHTNPATDPQSEASARIRAAGMSVAREGREFPL